MLLIFLSACTFALVAHAAGWLDDTTEKSPAELQLDEGRDNHFGEQKS